MKEEALKKRREKERRLGWNEPLERTLVASVMKPSIRWRLIRGKVIDAVKTKQEEMEHRPMMGWNWGRSSMAFPPSQTNPT